MREERRLRARPHGEGPQHLQGRLRVQDHKLLLRRHPEGQVLQGAVPKQHWDAPLLCSSLEPLLLITQIRVVPFP